MPENDDRLRETEAARPPLILASTSPYRQALLARLRRPFEVLAPPYAEERDLALPADRVVAHLARRKAESVQALHPEAVVIGADQAVALDGRLLGKPGTTERAEAQLAELAGRTHRLLTALCVLAPGGKRFEHLEEYRLTMHPLTAEQIRAYVAADQPLDCAGSYKIERLGVSLFAQLEGQDPSAIQGLPLVALAGILAQLGLDPLDQPPLVSPFG